MAEEVSALQEIEYVHEWIERLYAEVAELKRHVVKQAPGNVKADLAAWRDLLDASSAISASWRGPGAVEEIRAQREK